MAFVEVGTYSSTKYSYTLLYDGDKTFDIPLDFRVLNHVSRKGISSVDFSVTHFPSDVTVRFFNNTDDVMSWFNGSGDRTFMIKIKEGSDLIFQGLYLPSPQYRSFSRVKGTCDLKFHDGIKLLEKIPHNITSYTTVSDFLRDCLDDIGYSLPIKTMINITGANILINDYSPESMRTKFASIIDRNPEASKYELLMAFLGVFEAFIYQEDGYWKIKEHAYREASAPLNYLIATNGSVTSESLNRPIVTPTIIKDSKYTNLRGFSGLKRTAINNNKPFSLQNNDFTKWNEARTVLEDWDLESGTIIPPFQFEDYQGVIFTDVSTSLFQKVDRISTGYGLPEFTFNGDVYLDGAVGTYDIAIAEVIVYVRDAEDRESGFTKYYAHQPSISTVLSLTRELVYATVEITSGHSVNVPVSFTATIDIPLTLYRDFYFEIRLLDEDEAVLYTHLGRRRQIDSVELETQKSLQEAPSEELIEILSSNTEGELLEEDVYFTDSLISKREPDFQVLDENLDWIDVFDWKDRFETDGEASNLNAKVATNFLELYGSARLFAKLLLLKSEKPSLNSLVKINYEGTLKDFDVLFIQEEASSNLVKVYAIERG